MGEENNTKKDNYKRILEIKRDAGLERKFESIEKFDNSFFRDNYYSAFVLTKKIIDRNKKIEEELYLGQEKLYNIITFCGGRGSGKTSAADSVIKVLCDAPKEYKEFIGQYYDRNEIAKAEKNDLDRLLEENEFICMDVIDASLLEEKEDILDVILSKIFQNVRNCSSNFNQYFSRNGKIESICGKEEICRLIEDICQSKQQFQRRMDRGHAIGESSIEILGNLAGSMDIRKKLRELIHVYLEILCKHRNKKAHLVISIDDLDLHENAYGMLEQLHRYLMIPQVIIYLAVSEREIQSVCKEHFKKMYDNPEELSLSYLEKVLPYSRRVYLPATFNGDFFNVLAEPNADKGEDANPDLDGYPVKRFLLREIIRKTRVPYDGCGSDTHFYEIENLRTLINTYYLLDSMGKFEKDKLLNYKETLDRNYEKLRNDVVGRMASRKLNSPEQKQIFRQYYEEDFSCNGEYLVRKIAQLTNEDVQDYNYGELLGSLYMLEIKRQEFKPLIQCVLALATIELTQNYIYAFWVEDMNSQKKWNEYIAGSVIGSWGNQIFPKVKIADGVSSEIAYVKEYTVFASVEMEKESTEDKTEVCKWLIEEQGIVETFMLVYAFFIGEMISLEIIEKKLSVKLSVSKCTFDILGFVIHSMDCEMLVERAKKVVLDALMKYACPEEKEEKGSAREKLEKLINERSVIKDYEKWNKDYKGMALPIYSLDIMYNVLKRVKKKMERKFFLEIDKKDFLPTLQTFYKYIGDCLMEEDLFYGKRNESEDEIKEEEQYTKFYSAFLKNPYVRYFVREKEEDEKTEKEKRVKEGKKLLKPGPTIEQPIDILPKLFKSIL